MHTKTEQIGAQLRIAIEVIGRRERQDVRWGGDAHDDTHGAADFFRFISSQVGKALGGHLSLHRERLIDIAALAFAGIEMHDRKAEAARAAQLGPACSIGPVAEAAIEAGLARRLSKSSVSYLASTDAAYWAAFSRFVAILSSRTLADCAQFELANEISTELARARARFPDPVGSMRALKEEVGGLAMAVLDESPLRVRAEAVQTAVMAIRVGTEGDPSFDGVRAARRLAPIGGVR